jgi:hypothetical protein
MKRLALVKQKQNSGTCLHCPLNKREIKGDSLNCANILFTHD